MGHSQNNFDIRYDDLFTRKRIEEGHSTEKHLQDIGLLGGGGALTAGGVWELKKAFSGADVARPLGAPVEAATRELFKKPQ